MPAPVVTPPRAPASGASRRRRRPSPSRTRPSLKEETALLGAANAALGRGDVKRALSLLDDYDRRPGRGVCSSQERVVTGILAACAAGRVDAAREDARQFRARWPRSPLGARVDGSCAGSADPRARQP